MDQCTVGVRLLLLTGSSGTAYMGYRYPKENVEFHQTVVVLEHICDANQIAEVTLAFAALLGQSNSKCSAVSSPLPQCGQVGDGSCQ